jgi:hypothetical protein
VYSFISRLQSEVGVLKQREVANGLAVPLRIVQQRSVICGTQREVRRGDVLCIVLWKVEGCERIEV